MTAFQTRPAPSPDTMAGALKLAVQNLLVYGAIGTVTAALVSLGTDGIKLTLVATIAGFGAAVSLAAARDLPLPAVLGLGAGLLVALHALAIAINALVPFTVYHPISSAVSVLVLLGLVVALRPRTPRKDSPALPSETDADA